MWRRPLRYASLAVSAMTALWAQQPQFDVVSVKRGGDVFSTQPDRSGGRLRWTTQLCYLIGYAHGLDFSRVTGRPCGAVYSIEATFDPAASDDAVRAMARSLLSERFRLRARRKSIQADGHALFIDRGGLRIRQSKAGDEPPAMPEWARDATPELKAATYISAVQLEGGAVAITGRRVSIARLAETLGRVLKQPVWDHTGLAGEYYFAFRFASVPSPDADTDAPSLATALRESLGLRLDRRKGPVETLVIESMAEPTEN